MYYIISCNIMSTGIWPCLQSDKCYAQKWVFCYVISILLQKILKIQSGYFVIFHHQWQYFVKQKMGILFHHQLQWKSPAKLQKKLSTSEKIVEQTTPDGWKFHEVAMQWGRHRQNQQTQEGILFVKFSNNCEADYGWDEKK